MPCHSARGRLEVSKIETNLLTAQEVADILKIKKSTVYEMIKRGELASHKIGKQLRVSHQELERLLGSGTVSDGQKSSILPKQLARNATSAPQSRGNGLVLCGQDALLDILANRMNAMPNMPGILRSNAGSYNGLYKLYYGTADIATAHLWDEVTGEYNVPFVERLLPGIPVIMVRLLGRMTGLYVRSGNPKHIHGFEDFGRNDITLVNREKGSGSRVLLDGKLKSFGINRLGVPGYYFEQPSSLAVASCVARGAGDVGVGVETVATQVSGIEFIPIQQEWYDMVFCADQRNPAPIRAILEYISSEEFRNEVAQLNGYDSSQTGRIIIGDRYL